MHAFYDCTNLPSELVKQLNWKVGNSLHLYEDEAGNLWCSKYDQ